MTHSPDLTQKITIRRSNFYDSNQKIIQTLERDRLLEQGGNFFITFWFPLIVGNRSANLTSFGMGDVSTGKELIAEWCKRMDRKFLGEKGFSEKDSENRMKWVVIPEVRTKTGERTPLHFHGIFEIDEKHYKKMMKYGLKVWIKLLRNRFPHPNVVYPDLLDIRQINDENRHKVIPYPMKFVGTEWNWEKMGTHHDYLPSTLPLRCVS